MCVSQLQYKYAAVNSNYFVGLLKVELPAIFFIEPYYLSAKSAP